MSQAKPSPRTQIDPKDERQSAVQAPGDSDGIAAPTHPTPKHVETEDTTVHHGLEQLMPKGNNKKPADPATGRPWPKSE